MMTLADYLNKHRMKKVDFAKALRTSPSYVTQLCQGTIWPSRHVVNKISDLTGGAVTANDFTGRTPTASGAAAGKRSPPVKRVSPRRAAQIRKGIG